MVAPPRGPDQPKRPLKVAGPCRGVSPTGAAWRTGACPPAARRRRAPQHRRPARRPARRREIRGATFNVRAAPSEAGRGPFRWLWQDRRKWNAKPVVIRVVQILTVRRHRIPVPSGLPSKQLNDQPHQPHRPSRLPLSANVGRRSRGYRCATSTPIAWCLANASLRPPRWTLFPASQLLRRPARRDCLLTSRSPNVPIPRP